MLADAHVGLAHSVQGDSGDGCERSFIEANFDRHLDNQVARNGNDLRMGRITNARTGDTVALLNVVDSGFHDDAGTAISQLLESIQPVPDLFVSSEQALTIKIVEHLSDKVRPQTSLLHHRRLGDFDRGAFCPGTDKREYIADKNTTRPEFRRGQLVHQNLTCFLVLDYLKQ